MSQDMREIAPLEIEAGALRSDRSDMPEKTFRWALFAALAVALLTLATLLIFIFTEGWPRFNLQLFTNMPSIRLPELAGAQSAIMGSIWVIATTAVITVWPSARARAITPRPRMPYTIEGTAARFWMLISTKR